MREDFLPAVQWHVARLSVGASAARGQRAPGLVDAARAYLATMPLGGFGVISELEFRDQLDDKSDDLMRELPRRGRSWGIARKLLNIFLRNSLYDFYLRTAWNLDRSEYWFEVPLDSIVAKQLRSDLERVFPERPSVSRWPGVKYVTRPISDEYQRAIRDLAADMKIAPIHKDIYWWSGPREA
jgi:hypothetical protein